MNSKKWTIKELLAVTTQYLNSKGIDSPRIIAEVLLAHVLHMDRVSLYVNFDKPLTESEVSEYRSVIRRRVQKEPLQYITGVQEFWSLEFKVDPRVLIPRPETELLVEQAIDIAKQYRDKGIVRIRILDLCTGCGAIAIALAKELPGAFIWATDVSNDALEVAEVNAKNHGVEDRIRFLQGDLWDPIIKESLEFDIIVSNPPYVATAEYEELAPEIRNHEPKIALEAGPDGMRLLEIIIQHAHEYLVPNGWLVLEMSPLQIDPVLDLVSLTQKYNAAKSVKDYSGNDRIVVAQRS